MARYALVRPDNSIDRFAENIDPNVPTKAGFRWLPCPAVAPPSFNSDTEIVDGPTYAVGASLVTEGWTKRLKNAEELDADKDRLVAAIAKAQLRVMFNHENRIRALAGQASVTQAQFLAAIKALL